MMEETRDLQAIPGVRAAPSLKAGGALVAATALPRFGRAATNYPAIGTYPAGSSGASVTIGIAVPRTGTYAVQGEDELKGWQLAVEHINSGHDLIKKISPKTTKGVLGKEVKYRRRRLGRQAERGRAGAAALHHREQDRSLMTGSTSSAVAVALNKLAAAREGALRRPASPARTTPPARTACATASARTSTARRRPTRSARCCSRPSARTRRRRS